MYHSVTSVTLCFPLYMQTFLPSPFYCFHRYRRKQTNKQAPLPIPVRIRNTRYLHHSYTLYIYTTKNFVWFSLKIVGASDESEKSTECVPNQIWRKIR